MASAHKKGDNISSVSKHAAMRSAIELPLFLIQGSMYIDEKIITASVIMLTKMPLTIVERTKTRHSPVSEIFLVSLLYLLRRLTHDLGSTFSSRS